MNNKHDKDMNNGFPKDNQNRRISNKLLFAVCLMILAVGAGIAIFYMTGSGSRKESGNSSQLNNPNQEDITPTPQVMTVTPRVSPTADPTATPTVKPTQPAQDDNQDTRNHSVTARGLYVPSGVAGTDRINKLIKIADDTEVNAMVIDVKDDQGRITYAMDCSLAKEIGAVSHAIPDMDSLVKTLKEKKIYLIARIVSFRDPLLADKRPDLAILNKDGSVYIDSSGLAWVNPYKKEVWDYLVSVAEQAASVGFDEIQFDYIRFSTGKGIDQVDYGEDAKKVSKEEIITEFTKYAYERLKPLGVYVSADVFGTIIVSSVDAKRVGQDYEQMAKYLDFICPMIYPSHFGEGNLGIQYPDTKPYEIISSVLQKSKDKLSLLPENEHCAIVRPWLQDFTATWVKHHIRYGGNEIRKQIKGVYSVGYDEWLLWNSGGNYTEDGLLEE